MAAVSGTMGTQLPVLRDKVVPTSPTTDPSTTQTHRSTKGHLKTEDPSKQEARGMKLRRVRGHRNALDGQGFGDTGYGQGPCGASAITVKSFSALVMPGAQWGGSRNLEWQHPFPPLSMCVRSLC